MYMKNKHLVKFQRWWKFRHFELSKNFAFEKILNVLIQKYHDLGAKILEIAVF